MKIFKEKCMIYFVVVVVFMWLLFSLLVSSFFVVVVVPFVCFGRTDPVVAKITGACIRSAKYWVLVSLYERLVDRARLDEV